MSSQIQFDLTNPNANPVMVVLIPAGLRRKGLLKGKYPEETKFKDEAGQVEIALANVVPAGAITELNEYADQFIPVTVTGIRIGTNDLSQGTLNFTDRTYVEFKQPVVANIDSTTSVVPGVSAIQHDFKQPWTSSAMKSLEMKLLPGQTVTVVLQLQMPDFNQIVMQAATNAAAAILPHQ